MIIINEAIHFFMILLAMICCHEFGHWLVLRFKAVWYKFEVNRKYWGFKYELHNKNNIEEALLIYVIAILMGLIPMFIFPLPTFWNAANMLFILYGAGCWFDIKQIDMILVRSIKAGRENK